MARGQWVRAGGRSGSKPPEAEKRAITAACERFDLSYFRHTEQWWPVDRGVTLDEALALL